MWSMGGSAFRAGVVALVIAVLFTASARAALIIDPFTTAQTVFAGGVNPTTVSQGIAAPGALGGNRLLTVQRTTGTGIVYADVSGGLMSHGNGPANAGIVSAAYDGNADTTFDPSTGLGGIDLTQGGTNNGLVFNYHADLAGAVIIARIYSSATDFSVGSINTLSTGGFVGPGITDGILFSSMSIGGGAGANFSSVRGVVLSIDGSNVPALDLQISSVLSDIVPEPASLSLLAIGSLFTLRRRR
jgi:hypothetical protein